VRAPKHVVTKGRTPILSPEEARALFESIPTDSLVGLRDRALICVLIYSFARISAALSMRVEDYFPQGKRWWLRLHEKGGKNHEMPVHHSLEAYLDEYVRAAGIAEEPKRPLFRAEAFGTADGAQESLRYDPAASQSGRARHPDRLPHLSPPSTCRTATRSNPSGPPGSPSTSQRRHPRESADDGSPLKPAHHQAL
jgi:integrase